MNANDHITSFPEGYYKKLYHMLLNAIPSSALILDRRLRVMSANKNFLVKSRQSLVNILGRKLEAVFPSAILEQMDIEKQILRVFRENRPTPGKQFSYRAPGIHHAVYFYRLFPFSWEGRVAHVLLFMVDVTEQVALSKEMMAVERYLARVIESASDMIISTDQEFKILSWNPASEKITGYSLEEASGCYFFNFCSEKEQKKIKHQLAKMKNGVEPPLMQLRLITKDHKEVTLSWTFSLMINHEEKVTGYVGVGRDRTRITKLEEQLRKSQKFASLGAVAGGIAHQIRNPLGNCSSAAQFLMEKGIDPPFRRECARQIHSSLKKVSSIIENMLNYAAPGSVMEEEKIPVEKLILDALDRMIPEYQGSGIKVETEFPEAKLWVRGNYELLKQALINLFSNSIEAMQNGGTLGVTLGEKNRKIIIGIKDSGCGIPEENIKKIFDPFFTASLTGKGVGLGLSICYSILERHAGAIDVKSREGKGTLFTITLPGDDVHGAKPNVL